MCKEIHSKCHALPFNPGRCGPFPQIAGLACSRGVNFQPSDFASPDFLHCSQPHLRSLKQHEHRPPQLCGLRLLGREGPYLLG